MKFGLIYFTQYLLLPSIPLSKGEVAREGKINNQFYYLSTFLLPFICEAKGRRKASKRRRKSTLFSNALRAYFLCSASQNNLTSQTRTSCSNSARYYFCRASSVATSEAKSAGLPATAIQSRRPQGVGKFYVLLFSFRTFLFSCLVNKKKEKYKKNLIIKLTPS